MLNTKRSRWIAAGVVAALLVAAGTAVAGEGGRTARKARHRRMARAIERIEALSDEQAKTALDASRDLGRIREDARARAAAVLLQARRDVKASPDQRAKVREAARAKLKALRAELRAPAAEAGMKVVRTLTPEQKAKIEAAAKARGRTVTDDGLARFFGRRLARPWATALLRARVETK